MYKLTIRRKRYLFVLALAIFGALVVVLPSHNPDKTVKLSFLVLILGELVLSGLLAMLFYPKANPVQLVQIGLTVSSFVVFLGGIGSLGSNATRAMPGGDIVISWIQLAIMNLGGVVSTLALWTLSVAKSATAEAPPEPEIKSNEVVAKLKTESARSRDKMPAFTDEDLAQNSAVRSSQTGIPAANPSTSGSGIPAQRPGNASGQGLPSASATRLTSEGKKGSSTFTKLQALSASGTGSLHGQSSPGESLISEPDGLKSILDRLDSSGQASSSPSSTAPAAKKITDVPPSSPPERPSSPSMDKIRPSTSLPIGEIKAPPKSSISSRLLGVVTGNRIPSVEPPEKIIEPAFQSAVSKLDLDSIPTPKVEPEKPAAIDLSELEAIPTPKVVETEAESKPETKSESKEVDAPVSEVSKLDLDSIPTPKIGDTKIDEDSSVGISKSILDSIPTPKVGDVKAEAGAAEPTEVESKPSGISSTFASKALGVKSKFIGAGGSEVKRSSTSLDAFKGEIANQKAAALNPAARAETAPKEPINEPVKEPEKEPVEELVKEVASQAAPQPKEEASSGLFGKGVDSDVDDIFSNLAPAEAQREFDPALVNKDEPPVVAEEEEAPASSIFGVKVDAEVDDIFSNLAPEGAQKEFKKPEPEAETQPIPAPAPKKPIARAPGQDGIFDESVNDELDDIFSNLAPAEAQMTVADKERIVAQEESAEPEVVAEAEVVSETEAESFAPEVAEELQPEVQEESFAPHEPEESFEPAEAAQSESEGMMINPVTKNKEVKEFGRLSSRAPNVAGQAPTVGTMKTIGKLLLDVQAIENIIKSGEEGTIGAGLTNARVISAQRGEGIKALLNKIDSYSGVVGSLIVGHDGLVIAATVGNAGMDKDALGALSTALLSTSNLATLKLDIGKLRQMVMLTEHGANGSGAKPVTTVLTDVEVGILAVFLDSQDLERVDGLLDAIHETIHG